MNNLDRKRKWLGILKVQTDGVQQFNYVVLDRMSTQKDPKSER